jgi:hypothetical protein
MARRSFAGADGSDRPELYPTRTAPGGSFSAEGQMAGKDDKLDIEKQLAAKLLRYAAKEMRAAKSTFVAEETMRIAGQHLQALPDVLARLMPDSRGAEQIEAAAEELRQLRESGGQLH